MRTCVNKENKEAVDAVEEVLKEKALAYEKLESITFPGTIVFNIVGADMLAGVECMRAGASNFSV